jgi:hypothetical protein
VVETHFAKFIYENEGIFQLRVAQKTIQQSRLARTQKPGDHIQWNSHDIKSAPYRLPPAKA